MSHAGDTDGWSGYQELPVSTKLLPQLIYAPNVVRCVTRASVSALPKRRVNMTNQENNTQHVVVSIGSINAIPQSHPSPFEHR